MGEVNKDGARIDPRRFISVRGAKEDNLKNIDFDIPKGTFDEGCLVVVTGLSGSGKSAAIFRTVHAEAQIKYISTLSSYARQFLNMQNKPDVESITGLSPSIAINQHTASRNPRSTVATAAEIYDYFRILFSSIGIPYSPVTGKPIQKQSASQIADILMRLPDATRLFLLAPIVKGHKGEHRKELLYYKKQGYQRVKIDGDFYEFDELPTLDPNKKHNIEILVDRIVINPDIGNRLPDSIEKCLKLGDGVMYAEFIEITEDNAGNYKPGDVTIFSEKFSCPVSNFSLEDMEPRFFSFNSPYGACQACDGLGMEVFFDPTLIIPNKSLSLRDGAIAPWFSTEAKVQNSQIRFYQQTLEALARHYQFSLVKPYKELPEEIQNIILHGSDKEEITFVYNDGFRSSTSKRSFEGVIKALKRREAQSENEYHRDELSKFQSKAKCSVCNGYRLNQDALMVRVYEKNIGQICEMTIEEAIEWFNILPNHLEETQLKIAERIFKEINMRLRFMRNVGLEYLTLNREASSLSGGESQRIRLASQIGSGLTGIIYILDEPSIGLHQSDNDKLLHSIKALRDQGNTIIVIEHDEDTILAADYLIDMGPGAGKHGGYIIACGTPEEVMLNENSITGQYLCGKKYIPIPDVRRKGAGRAIKIYNARANNLKIPEVAIPLGTLVTITGVSGGGKSSLVIDTLCKAAIKLLNNDNAPMPELDKITGLEYIDKVIEVDQSPIGRTPRSNPATYTGVFTPIRDWYAALPEAKARAYKPGRFSFNVKGGRCETCEGDGMLKIEMHFLPDVYVKCEECKGARYNKETLEILYKGKSIADVLGMSVDDASEFFSKIPIIKEKLVALQEVGLGYISVGQSATTLSGGEAQRIKLAKELARRSTGRTLYVLDEPTTGLHTDDIKKLLAVLDRLVDSGNTVLIIEHNIDVIVTADHIIDIGPKGGNNGGKIVAQGTPEEVAANPNSITGKYIKNKLDAYNSKIKKESAA